MAGRILLSAHYANAAEKTELATFAAEAVDRSRRVLDTLPNTNTIRHVTTDPFAVDVPQADGSGKIVIGSYGSNTYLNYFQGQFGAGAPGSKWKVEKVVEFNRYAQLATHNSAAVVGTNILPPSSLRAAGGLARLSTIPRRPVNITGRARDVESQGNIERATAARGDTVASDENARQFASKRAESYNYGLANVTGRAPLTKDAELSHAFAIFSKNIDEGATPTVALAAASAVYAVPPDSLPQRLVEMYVEDDIQSAILDFNKELKGLSGRNYDVRAERKDALLIHHATQKYLEVGRGIIDTRNVMAVGEAIYNKWSHIKTKRGGARKTRKRKSKSRSKSKKRRHH